MSITDLWNDWLSEDKTLSNGLKITFDRYDITALLDKEGHILNPLMEEVSKMIQEYDGKQGSIMAAGMSAASKLEILPELRRMLNEVLAKTVKEPVITDKLLDKIPIKLKMEIFMYAIGGEEALGQAMTFPKEQSPTVADLPK